MKSSTGNIELPADTTGENCDGCKALRADVDVRGGKVRSVDLHCEVADAVDWVAVDEEAGVSVGQICRKIRAKMEKAECPFTGEKDKRKYPCGPLRDAAQFLAKQEKPPKRHRGPAIDQSAGEDVKI